MYSKIKVAGHPVHPTLVQDYHVGIRLAPDQELAELAVQHHQPSIPLRRRAV